MNLKRIFAVAFSLAFMVSATISAKPRKKPKKKSRSSIQVDIDAEKATQPTIDKPRTNEKKTEEQLPVESLKISHEHLSMTHAEKKQLFRAMTPDQFLDFMEDHATAIQKIEELESEMNKKSEEIKNLRKEIDIIKNNPRIGSGELADDALIQKIKSEGLDLQKLDFRVQVGCLKSYKAASKLEAKARSLGLPTYIVVRYEGFIIPLSLILEQLKKNKE